MPQLTEAHLGEAQLGATANPVPQLTEAHLAEAQLAESHLTEAQLAEAHLAEAHLGATALLCHTLQRHTLVPQRTLCRTLLRHTLVAAPWCHSAPVPHLSKAHFGRPTPASASCPARAAARRASVLLVWMSAVFDPLLLKSPVFSGVRSPRTKMELSEGGAMDCDDMMRPLTDDELSAQPTPIARSSAQWDASASARFVQAEVVDRRENYGSVCLLCSMSASNFLTRPLALVLAGHSSRRHLIEELLVGADTTSACALSHRVSSRLLRKSGQEE